MKSQSPNILKASQQNRRAFTLIELLIAITIIALLLGLLFPAIGSVRLAAQRAQVRAEISNLETAITAFRADFGMDPPSGIVLQEDGGATWDQRSKGLIRKMWPQFNFGTDKDINGDGDANDTITLNAGECLVFFLGGVYEKTTDGKFRVYGFSKNPARPFLNPGSSVTALSASNSSRLGPFFEFNNSRFVDTDAATAPAGEFAPEYLDSFPSQQTPYMYLSSYGGRGYRSTDLPPGFISAYREGDPTVAPTNSDQPYKSKSYQIISPGADNQFGTGGNYDTNKNFPIGRTVEADNITNFVSGSLK
ncbi:MAG: type II secretion system protein [Gimesia sp.]